MAANNLLQQSDMPEPKDKKCHDCHNPHCPYPEGNEYRHRSEMDPLWRATKPCFVEGDPRKTRVAYRDAFDRVRCPVCCSGFAYLFAGGSHGHCVEHGDFAIPRRAL